MRSSPGTVLDLVFPLHCKPAVLVFALSGHGGREDISKPADLPPGKLKVTQPLFKIKI